MTNKIILEYSTSKTLVKETIITSSDTILCNYEFV